jgi:hypothetical protein
LNVILRLLLLSVLAAAAGHAIVQPAPAQTDATETPVSTEKKPPPAAETPPVFPKEHHAWARFQPGSWKTYRLDTETLDEQGKVVSVNVTTTTKSLERVGESNYTLKVKDTVEVLGRKQVGDPQSITYNLFDQANGETTRVKNADNEKISIEGQEFECQSWIVESISEERTRTTKLLHYGDRCPYTLHRETSTMPAEGKAPSSTSVELVTAFDMPFKYSGNILSTSHIRTERKTPKGVKITIAVYCDKVPGGIVYYTSKELDAEGRLIRRGVLELIDYYLEGDRRPPRPRRKRDRRSEAEGNDKKEVAATNDQGEPITASDVLRTAVPR